MDARALKRSFKLEPDHLPNPAGINICMIDALDFETFVVQTTGEQVERNLLRFVDFPMPLRLNNTLIDTLIQVLGPETDGWPGMKVGLLVQSHSAFGKTEVRIGIHPTPVPQSAPHCRFIPFSQRQLAAVARQPELRQLPAGPITRPIGEQLAARFIAALASVNQRFDNFLAWLKAHHHTAFTEAYGAMVEELPDSLIPRMQEFLGSHGYSRPELSTPAAAAPAITPIEPARPPSQLLAAPDHPTTLHTPF